MALDAWTEVRLGDLVEIKHGWPFKSELFSAELSGRPIVVAIGNFRYTGGFRFDSTEIKEYRGEYPREFELKPGDILAVMTCQTPGGEILGVPARIPNDGRRYLHNQRMGKVVIKDTKTVDDRFLYYLFLWRELNQELVASSTGTKIVHTAPSRIEAFRFSLPPKRIQQAIGALLGALDDKRELNHRMNRTIEELASALFKSWFVDFNPVQAKRDGRKPVGVPEWALSLFPEHFEESDLGPLPKGWSTSTIGDEVRVVGGSTPRTEEPRYWNGDICWVTPRDLSRLSDPVVLGSERYITQEGLAQIGSGLLPRGTVLLSSRAPIGYLAITEVPVAVNQGFIAMDCCGRLPNHWVLKWTEQNMDEILSRAGGTTFAEISKANFRPIPVVVPSSKVLQAFEVLATPLHGHLAANVRENATLEKLRDTLLPALLVGEVTIKQAEKAVAEVA
ncbi:restriction endonuclease subunit S [Corallococcus sicarius]|uniref:Restriction endonuclease subunit S n=1 Tax=Corallococcus sicarius TaxID=2316726 RepID=A0A3A8NY13_9BACT|nr:restriction endonuclease subunit S [Corallococcus sicarius]RKH45022.1 restriction endonuclease subunit S [Corallococcus sicarius]